MCGILFVCVFVSVCVCLIYAYVTHMQASVSEYYSDPRSVVLDCFELLYAFVIFRRS